MTAKVGTKVVRQDGLKGEITFIHPAGHGHRRTCTIRDEDGLRHNWISLDGHSITSDNVWSEDA
jgi:hypothetical protein